MTTVTGLTASRMQEIIDDTVNGAHLDDDDLILDLTGGGEVNAGNVRGPAGPSGSGYVICTSGTRPSLVSGDEGVAIYETDTNLVRLWNGVRFEIQGPVTCTSATRPTLAAGDEGVEIYETDTNLKYYWSGTAFRRPPGDMGRLGSQTITADNTVNATDETIASAAITTTEQRIVMVSATAQGQQEGATSNSCLAYVDSTGTSVIESRNVFYNNSMSAGEPIVGSICFTVTLPAGTTTFRLRAATNVGTMDMKANKCQISVVDIAPS